MNAPILVPMRASLSVLAPAKLNLTLSVGAAERSANGMGTLHPICSWMVTINLFDELHVTRLEDDRLSRYAILWHADAKQRREINWSITKDLAVQAHLALEKHIGRSLPVQMKLEKRIPVGGGLGGGSTDAAAMLRAVNSLFDLQLTLDELASIGSTLGSDVPFLVRGGSAIVEGFGDRLQHADLPAVHAVVAFPSIMCPTPAVYQAFDELHESGGALARDDHGERPSAQWLIEEAAAGMLRSELLFNDLATPAGRVAPALVEHQQSLAMIAERPAHVSGSGSTLFVICDNELHAIALADAIEHKLNLPAVAVQSCSIPQHAEAH